MNKTLLLALTMLVSGMLAAQTPPPPPYNLALSYASFDPSTHDGVGIDHLVTGQLSTNTGTNCHGYAFWLAVGQPLPNGIGTGAHAPELTDLITNNLIDDCPASQATHVIWYITPPPGDPLDIEDMTQAHHSGVLSQFASFPASDGWVQSRNGMSPAVVLHKIEDFEPNANLTVVYFNTVWSMVPIDNEPPTPSAIFSCGAFVEDHVSCFQGNDGSAVVAHSTSGSGTTYQYDWSNGASSIGNNNLIPGNYTVTVTEAPTNHYCVSSVEVTGPESEFTGFDYTAHDPGQLCVGYQGTGAATATLAPGASYKSYSFDWDANTGNQTGTSATGLCYGQYELTMTHTPSGCVQTHIADVPIGFSMKRDVADEAENGNGRFQLYPNPMSEVLLVEVSGDQPLRVKLLTLEGLLVLDQTVQPGIRTIEVEQLSAGTYLVQLEDGDRIDTQKLIKY